MLRRLSLILGLGSLTLAIACTGDQAIEDDKEGDEGGGDGADGSDGSSDGGDGGSDGGDGGGDPGDTTSDARSVELGVWKEAVASDVIDQPGDKDFYRLEVEEGQYITVGTGAYALDEDTTPDTVIRIYNSDGEMIAENDDMPYRYQETDSAMHFRATYTGPYFVEVLEWSDWAGEGGAGDSTYTYELYAWVNESVEVESNDSDSATVERLGELGYWAGGEYDDGTYLVGYYALDPFGGFGYTFLGALESDEDTDWWVVQASADDDGSNPYYHLMWGNWPGTPSTMTPAFTLYNEDLQVVATTSDTEIYSTYPGTYYDTGIIKRVPAEGIMYLEVSRSAGTSGVGAAYAGQIGFFLNILAADWEDTAGEDIEDGYYPTWTVSEATPGFYYMRGGSDMSETDLTDSWVIRSAEVGGFEDRVLDVAAISQGYGSEADVMITIYDEDGETVLATINDNTDYSISTDPAVAAWPLPADSDTIYIVVEAEELGPDEMANYYYMTAYIYDPE
jgi:hypothetical protein